ncbi:hypothetical protein OAS18_05900 [Nitrospinaceae bacterium]|nr:hypothetical protein [Nitrospinaceae bacterium]
MAKDNPMIILTMCDFYSHERSDCAAQPILAERLNLEKQDSYKLTAGSLHKYKSPVDVLKERFHDPDL